VPGRWLVQIICQALDCKGSAEMRFVMVNDKKVLYSGMQATGNLTIGNYLGALKNWITLNEEYECFFGVMDLHSITIRQQPADFRKRARNLLALYIAITSHMFLHMQNLDGFLDVLLIWVNLAA